MCEAIDGNVVPILIIKLTLHVVHRKLHKILTGTVQKSAVHFAGSEVAALAAIIADSVFLEIEYLLCR